MGLGADRMDDEREGCVTKIAFCFPGQGSLEAGNGPRHRRGVPGGERGLPARIGGVRPRSRATLLRDPDRGARRHRCPATCSRRNEPCDPRRCFESAGLEPDVVVGHSVGEFAALAAAGSIGTAEAIGLVRERGLAMAEAARRHPGSMAAILGLEDAEVENLCRKIIGVWPANYNCPGQVVISGEHEAVEECCAEAESLGARRAVRLKVSGCVPQPAWSRVQRTGCAQRSSGCGSSSRSRPSCRP